MEIGFGEKNRLLGFKMDAGNSFIEKYSKEAFYHSEDFKKVVDSINDIALLGTAILSRWRYIHIGRSPLFSKKKTGSGLFLRLKGLQKSVRMPRVEPNRYL